MFALAFDVAVGGYGDGEDLPVVFGAEHMVAPLNRHQRFDEAMRGEEHSAEEERRDTGLGFGGGGVGRDGGREGGREGGRQLSSSINFQMSVAKNSLPPPPSSLTNNRRAALRAHRRCHADICAPAVIRECTSRGRAPPVTPAELYGGTLPPYSSAEHDVVRLPCWLHRRSVFSCTQLF